MSASARVAVVVPLFNQRAFVGEAIESVLAQSLDADAVELIVVDDGSSDGGGDVARGFGARVRVLCQENRGLSAARNAGIAAATAPYVTVLDADDRIHPEKLALQLDLFARRPDVGIVYTGWRYVDEQGRPLPQRGWSRDEGDVLATLVLGNLVPAHAVMTRRDAVVGAGGFDDTLTSLEDWELWLRLSRSGMRWACIDRPLADYRLRRDAMHTDAARMLANRIRVLDRFYGGAGLSEAVVAARPLAYRNAFLIAACDHYRAGEREAGAAAMRQALEQQPGFLGDAAAIRRLHRWLLPVGSQSEAMVQARRRPLGATVRQMLTDALADGPRALRWRAELAYWRTVVRLARKSWGATRRGDGDAIPAVEPDRV